ncbi:MAG TPA: PSD1 and planctomycete cytochrome C domain-containing protein [Bryobacterales bacterium]|nr:PSD1 and planctomycete cytochrome C domain-containing protein [Bryobacterales bacterium]
MRRFGSILVLFFCGVLGSASSAPSPSFESDIAPLLTAKCAACHSAATKTSGFSVANLEAVITGGNKHGRAVVPGHPEQSPLIQALRGEIAPKMPLGGELPADEIARIEEWIRRLPPEAANANDTEWRWPFEKPLKHEPPVVKNAAWVHNPIDAFVAAKLDQAGLTPAPPASKRTLARRVYLDLIGLPPTPDEVETFLADDSPEAYSKLVDKLLGDARYGERWGRHWLDLVRYGETSGLEGDGAIGNAWRYRDWVIRAFNADMPYDEFVIQQIAGGDEHSKTRNNYAPDPGGYIPTGFLRTAPWDRSNLVAAEVRQNYLSEVTTSTASIFLGLTVGCARCHDHKYDPIPQKDFYRLQAFFNAIQVEDRQGAIDLPEVPYEDEAFAAKAEEKIKQYEERLKEGAEKKDLDALEEQLLVKLKAAKAKKAEGEEPTSKDLRLEIKRDGQTTFSKAEQRKHARLHEDADRTQDPEENEALKAYEAELLAKLKAAYAAGQADPAARFEALTVALVRGEIQAQYSADSFFTEDEKDRHAKLSGALDVYRRRLGRWKPVVLAVRNVPGPPSGPPLAPTHLLIRGDYRQPGEAVEAGFPSAITGNSDPAEMITDRYRQFPTRGLRMTLARWIAGPDNPLTARVMVNRIWQHHFGQGIVGTASDFGKNGERPTHPELLDWLAVEFVEQGWSVKAIHRLMLLSNTYRQAAENALQMAEEADPDNRLLSRYQRRRLEAEVIRDGILHASGRLNSEMYGPSIFPPLPDDLADLARYGRTGGLMWEPNETEQDARRRSIYVFQRRSLPLPMLASFDALPFAESCPLRSATTTPLQALSMMNGYLVHEESQHLAERIHRDVGADRNDQVARAFEIVLNRPPTPDETRKFAAFQGGLASICRVLFNANEFLYVE